MQPRFKVRYYNYPANVQSYLLSGFHLEFKEPNETCVKTSILSTISAGGSMLLGILLVSLLLTCSKLRNRKKDSGLYDAYVNHKGQID